MAKPPKKLEYENAGPARLATEPAKAPAYVNKPDPNWQALHSHLNARLNQLRSWRFSWMEHYALLEDYILPRRGAFINASMPTPNTMVRGMPINQNIVDPTGTQAMQVCASGLMSGLLSPSRPWFKIKTALPTSQNSDAVDQWCEEVTNRMIFVLGKSNFYDSAAQMFEDLTTFGTSPVLIYEDDRDVIRCQVPCPGEYFLASSSANRVESVFRQYTATVVQIVEMFGLENCPRDIQILWQAKGASLEIEKIVCHAIEPNFPVDGKNGGEAGMVEGFFAWREAYWVWGSTCEKPLALNGFVDTPFCVPRWSTTSNDAYGRSVAMNVLPDVMQLQQMTRRLSEAIEKQVRPPMLADISMANTPSSILPGKVTYVSQLGPDKGMRPIYTVQPDIRGMEQLITQIQARIKDGFLVNLFLLHSDTTKEMTAYETAQRQQEKLQTIGPVIERFQNEFAGPAITRVFNIMQRKKLLPEMPPELQGVPLDIEYVSMLVLAQKAASTSAMERFMQASQQIAQQYPEAHFAIDMAEAMPLYADELGVPKRMVRDPDQIRQLVAQQQKQQQQAQQAAQQQAAAQTAVHASKAVGNVADAAQNLGMGAITPGGGLDAIAKSLGLGAGSGAAGG